tara:strand:+ start:1371 stop:1565 length:195 start_codon:yes stop_codon:yes gene_type:complete
VNYTFSFSVSLDSTKKSTIPNMYHLTNKFQQLLKKYNLKVEGYLLEQPKFTPHHPEDFNQEVIK